MTTLPINQDTMIDNEMAYAVITIAPQGASCICDVFETKTEAIDFLRYRESKNPLYTYQVSEVFVKA